MHSYFENKMVHILVYQLFSLRRQIVAENGLHVYEIQLQNPVYLQVLYPHLE